MGIGDPQLVREIDAQTCRRIAERPDLSVLTVWPLRMIGVLLMQVLNNTRLSPLKMFIFKPGDFPGPLPLVVTGDIFVDRQNEIQPPPKKEVAVGADRVRLQTPGLCAICRPAGPVIAVPYLFRPNLIAKRVEGIVLIPLGARANKRIPVDGSPV